MGDAAGLGLDPVREALLAEAKLAAVLAVRQASERADAQVVEAEAETTALVDRARAEGEAAAELEAAATLALARRRARSAFLQAQREVYDGVRRQAHEAAQELRSTPRYDELVERLAARAAEVLGAGAEIVRDPPDGGVLARAGNRRLDYTLPVLVERCLARHATEIERLWT
jgi:vacuolar-type H+-ATPase subunit E/Vma4